MVLATVWVALRVELWSRVELTRELQEGESVAVQLADSAVADIASEWTDMIGPNGNVRLGDIATRHSAQPTMALVLLDSARSLRASTDSTLSLLAADAQGVTLQRLRTSGGEVFEDRFKVGTQMIRSAGRVIGEVALVPVGADAERGASEDAAGLSGASDGELNPTPLAASRAALRRTLLRAVIAASIVAALASLLVAAPLVGRVRALANGADAVAHGALHTRVDAHGRDELAELARSFNHMAGALEQADQHKRTLITDVAHELRTPLTNIIGSLEAMQDGLRPVDEGALQTLHREASLLATLIEELQELSLAESGQLSLHIDRVDAVAAAREAGHAMQDSAPALRFDLPTAGTALHVRADPRRLAQVLRNLLQNAIAHTPPGGTVSMRVSHNADSTSALSDVQRESCVRIEVSDTGRGIPAEHLPLIWERFHRVDASRDRSRGGMGLGLALVRQLVSGMGGSVHVVSTEGAGSTFAVVLPAAAEA